MAFETIIDHRNQTFYRCVHCRVHYSALPERHMCGRRNRIDNLQDETPTSRRETEEEPRDEAEIVTNSILGSAEFNLQNLFRMPKLKELYLKHDEDANPQIQVIF